MFVIAYHFEGNCLYSCNLH